jgi:hypothetical protein
MRLVLTILTALVLTLAGHAAAQAVVCQEVGHRREANPYSAYVPRGDYKGLGPSGYYIGRYLLGGKQREREAWKAEADALSHATGLTCTPIGTTIVCCSPTP